MSCKEMVQASLYQLSATPFINGLAKLLMTILKKDFKVHLLCLDEDSKREWDSRLWTYSSLEFVPHATDNDPLPEQQPILLSCSVNNINNARVLLANHTVPKSVTDYQRFVSIYDVAAQSALKEQRLRLENLQIPCSVFEEVGGAWRQIAS